ncbi:MAG: peptide chain release factor N(5)-glutamine methyltransferase [Endomicrobium sp.]|jgi:release factor glutamine methyltransferase|nr:peptide chain release factor N(5)-glutamine methyltransferase [Endomicrobium sp.]
MFYGKSIFNLLKTAERFLKSKGICESKSDAQVVLSFVLNIKRQELFFRGSLKPTYEQISKFKDYILRRSEGEPVAYITGFAGFMGFEFKVNNNVLIPRPETEILVERVLEFADMRSKWSVLDLCTGSGCIAVALAKLGVFENITASDISENAINIAKENAQINNAININFVKSDIFDGISGDNFDIIVSNPPYVSEEEYCILKNELKFEPKNALVAKNSGLFFYREISNRACRYLKNTGIVFLELNANKAYEIRSIFLDSPYYKNLRIVKDYAGLPRVLEAEINI